MDTLHEAYKDHIVAKSCDIYMDTTTGKMTTKIDHANQQLIYVATAETSEQAEAYVLMNNS